MERAVGWSHRRRADPWLSDRRSASAAARASTATPRAPSRGCSRTGVDYLCLEALAELTLAILQKDRGPRRVARLHRDLPRYLGAALPAVLDGRTKVITNAGGINPRRPRTLRSRRRGAAGAPGLRIATVMGDDLMPRLDEVRRRHRLRPRQRRDRGAVLATMGADALFFAAYLGAFPIADALAQGADIVITGRVADAALFLASADPRARVGTRRLGPARGGHPRRAPARVLGPGRGRELQRRLVDDPRALAAAVPDRRGRGRRHRGDHQAAGFGRARRRRHRPPPAALRGARSRGLPLARRRRRLHLGDASPTSAATGSQVTRRPRPARHRHLQGAPRLPCGVVG